ncbi:MAG: N-formylglutamate amidohydrolase [Rhodospirillales bacterium]|nr:N-formylglutamate amidohydrolase [Rhodospirillales bacterium]
MDKVTGKTVPGVLQVFEAADGAAPVVLDSPHSGTDYPDDFRTIAPESALLSCVDLFVDDLYSPATRHGATQLCALFPRSYIDANRADTDIDAELLNGPWPGPLIPTEKTRLGLGLIRRFAIPGQPMYDRKLSVAEVQNRIDGYYCAYHNELGKILDGLHAQFGAVWHIDCHSMKSLGNAMTVDSGNVRPDFVVSDRQGETCAPEFLSLVVETLRGFGYGVSVNDPYKGAELIRRYGRPAERRNSLQIEINRKIYMDESAGEKTNGYGSLKAHLEQLIVNVCEFARAHTS